MGGEAGNLILTLTLTFHPHPNPHQVSAAWAVKLAPFFEAKRYTVVSAMYHSMVFTGYMGNLLCWPVRNSTPTPTPTLTLTVVTWATCCAGRCVAPQSHRLPPPCQRDLSATLDAH